MGLESGMLSAALAGAHPPGSPERAAELERARRCLESANAGYNLARLDAISA